MVKYLDTNGDPLMPDDVPEWRTQFAEDSSSGWECRICHALVPRFPTAAVGHLAWHEEVDGR